MKLGRRNAVLAGLVAVLLVLELWLGGAQGVAPPPRALLPELSPARAARVRVEQGERSVELVRDTSVAADEAGAPRRWHVRERFDHPAHGAAVEAFLAHFASLRSDDLVGTEASSHARFGLGAEATRVRVEDADGRSLVDAWVGRATGAEGEPVVGSYVRLAGDDRVYRAAALADAPADPRRWLDTRLVAFDPGAVRSITLEGRGVGGLPRHLVREEDGRWGVAGEARRLLPARVDPVLLLLANLYFEDVLGADPAAAGLDDPHWRVRLERGDAQPVGLRVAAPASEDGLRALALAGGETAWVVGLSGGSAERLDEALASLAGDAP